MNQISLKIQLEDKSNNLPDLLFQYTLIKHSFQPTQHSRVIVRNPRLIAQQPLLSFVSSYCPLQVRLKVQAEFGQVLRKFMVVMLFILFQYLSRVNFLTLSRLHYELFVQRHLVNLQKMRFKEVVSVFLQRILLNGTNHLLFYHTGSTLMDLIQFLHLLLSFFAQDQG